MLTVVSANDVDTNPALTYSFVEDNKSDETSAFAIDRFSGKIILKSRLDYETKDEYQLKIAASDTAHTAYTSLTIRVTDVNDNAPIFHQPAYHVTLPGLFFFSFYLLERFSFHPMRQNSLKKNFSVDLRSLRQLKFRC